MVWHTGSLASPCSCPSFLDLQSWLPLKPGQPTHTTHSELETDWPVPMKEVEAKSLLWPSLVMPTVVRFRSLSMFWGRAGGTCTQEAESSHESPSPVSALMLCLR